MAQNYTEQLRKDNVRDAIYEDLQNNCEVLRTSWSGNAFPANPKVGQPCYRVDEDKLYYWDGLKWSQKGGGGSAELKSMELPAIETERVSIILEGARCLDKNMMFVFVDKIAQDPSTYSMNDDGTVVNFNPAIPANAAVTLRWFDTDVGTFDTAIFASDAEFAAGELTNRAPNVKQVHSLSDMVASKLSGLELMDVGFAPLGIDESKNKRRYLNGQVIIQSQFPAFTAAVKARMTTMANAFTTESNWQAEKTNSKLGQCGKFVVDDTVGTIRLPCVVNAQGLVDLALIGGIKSESLPNITGNGYDRVNDEYLERANTTASGAFYCGNKKNSWGASYIDNGTYETNRISFNASRSSSTYQDNAPVQQEAVQYPYYIQVATGVEETLPAIREYEINTPFFFGQSMYSDVAPDNASWLASNGQYNARSVYPDYYDWLVEKMNAGVSGFVASTATYTDYDFVINQNDQTFRLPLLNGEEDLPDYEHKIDNVITGTINSTGQTYTAPKSGLFYQQVNIAGDNSVAVTVNNVVQQNLYEASSQYSTGFNVEVRKGDIIKLFVGYGSGTGTIENCWLTPFKGNGTLYYYVGETVQDASLINAGAILGQLSDKISRTAASDKEMVVGWGMPDYTAGIDISGYKSSANQFTAPKDGILSIVVNSNTTGFVYINDTVRAYANNNDSYARIPITLPISKGEKFYAPSVMTQGSWASCFYPFKGVN